MIVNYSKRVILITAVILITGGFFFSPVSHAPIAQASLLDMIRALVTINPLQVEITTPGEALVNEVFKVEATVINKGEERLSNAQAEIFLPPGLTLKTKKQIRKLGVIPPHKKKTLRWLIRGEQSGNYIVLVSARGEIKEQTVSAEASTIVVIIDKVGTENKEAPNVSQSSPSLWQGFLNLFRDWLK